MINKIKELTIFVLAIFSYFLSKVVAFVSRGNVKLPVWFNRSKPGVVSRVDLIDLSLQNLRSKKTRTWITIGGMTIGIASIVFLVSLGYGVQELVVNRVARLEEMQQTDVVPPSGGKLKIDDNTVSSLKSLQNVKMVLPLISVVGRVNYQNSVSDVAVYGVTADYLRQSAIKPNFGKIFESNELAVKMTEGEVAGVSTENTLLSVGDEIGKVSYEMSPNTWIRVRENPDSKSKIIGYTRRAEGQSQGTEYWGKSYLSDNDSGKAGTDEEGNSLGKWIEGEVFIWEAKECDSQNSDCIEGKYLAKRDSSGSQIQETGYMAEVGMTVKSFDVNEDVGQVLGTTATNNDGSLPQVEIASESASQKPVETKSVALSSEAKLVAVVNTALLNVLGIKENEAVGKKFTSTFVVVGNLLAVGEDKVESVPTEYTVVGVIPDNKTPMFYVPFIDLRSLGIVNYSQIKMVVSNPNELSSARRQIEAMGYVTRSVADTVQQINSLFATAKTILALLGFMALAVAALGMFNTLTVSLMERTREVGLMKAMGMKSSEIRELFLSESLIMGLGGGIFGLILGFVLGKLLGLILSLFSVIKGVGMVDVSYIPLPFVLMVIFLSLVIGIVTGFYPARRATKISALNALRYE